MIFKEVRKTKNTIETRKKEAETILKKCAKLYKERLLNKNVMFITMKAGKEIQAFEVRFLKENFLHLTGVEINKEEISSKAFFDRCINNKISINDFEFRKDNTTDMKLKILQTLVTIDMTANILGDFDYTKMFLQTKKMAANISACMGFQYYQNIHAYIPNTALKEDIRNITINRARIVTILKKDVKQKLYSDITYIAKNINIFEILNNKNIKKKIDFQNLYSKKDSYKSFLSKLNP